jgi:hypothetical protein
VCLICQSSQKPLALREEVRTLCGWVRSWFPIVFWYVSLPASSAAFGFMGFRIYKVDVQKVEVQVVDVQLGRVSIDHINIFSSGVGSNVHGFWTVHILLG